MPLTDEDADVLSSFAPLQQVSDAVACCKLCEATKGCAIANYAAQKGCQLIAPPFSPTSRLRSVALSPPSSGSLPMPIPAIAVAEQHGPCETHARTCMQRVR